MFIDKSYRPSPSSGEEKVADSPAEQSTQLQQEEGVEVQTNESGEDNIGNDDVNSPTAEIISEDSPSETQDDSNPKDDNGKQQEIEGESIGENIETTQENEEKSEAETENAAPTNQGVEGGIVPSEKQGSRVSLRDEEQYAVGAEILFPRTVSPLAFGGWDNLRWMSFSGARKIQHCQNVDRLVVSEKKGLNLFGIGASNSSEAYLPRKLVIYQEPTLFLLLRPPSGPEELRELLDLPEGADLDKSEHSMETFLVVEAAAEPISCKLRLSPLTTPTSVTEEGDENLDAKRRSCFHLITPLETIAMTAIVDRKKGVSYTDSAAFMETTTVELAIGKTILNSHSQGEEAKDINSDMSWKHQLILGTLHSDIILGSQKLLEKAIVTAMKRSKDNVVSFEGKNYLQTRLVDKFDDAGLTPLHYACFHRFSIAVADLVNSGARIDIRTQKLEMAPIHLCAENLDHKSLSILLSATFPVKPNPNMMDALGRTPMYIATIDGRGPSGSKDAAALGRCIMALEAWGGEMLPNPTISQLRWPQSVLAAAWEHRELAEVLRHSALRYPLPDTLLNGASIGAIYQYPLHWALISLVKETQAFYNQEEGSVLYGAYEYAPENKVAQTILTLLDNGFEPNERLDRLDEFCKFAGEYEEFVGYAPIQILACVALEADNLKGRVAENELEYIFKIIDDVAEIMVKNGARLSLEAPPSKRSISMNESSASSHQDVGPIIDAYDRSSLKLDSNKKLLNLLGGNDRLNAAKKAWLELKSIPAPPNFALPFEHESALEDKFVPGGTNEKSCAICWREFGSIMNRRHKCRITLRYVCDECSSKRAVYDGNDQRISDGQFTMLCTDTKRAEQHASEMKRQQQEAQIEHMTRTREEARKKRLDEEAQRESLFGGVMGKAASFLAGEDESESKPAAAAVAAGEQINGLSESLGNTRNALLDRGDKLNSLSDKSAQMVDASANFAKMAKELQKQSEKGFFW